MRSLMLVAMIFLGCGDLDRDTSSNPLGRNAAIRPLPVTPSIDITGPKYLDVNDIAEYKVEVIGGTYDTVVDEEWSTIPEGVGEINSQGKRTIMFQAPSDVSSDISVTLSYKIKEPLNNPFVRSSVMA